jgi:hypothetical protein
MPCKTCLVFPLCKSRLNYLKPGTLTFSGTRNSYKDVVRLCERCSILKDYLHSDKSQYNFERRLSKIEIYFKLGILMLEGK